MRRTVLIAALVCGLVSPGFAWMDPNDPNVATVLDSQDNRMAFYNGPSGQTEWLINYGQSTIIRVKGYDDPSIFKWNLAAYSGKTIVEAELHLARYGDAATVASNPIHALVVSTINNDWFEGTKSAGTATTGDSCWRWRSYPANPANPLPSDEWTYIGSDFTTASFGNYGTLVSFGFKADDTFKQYDKGGYTWVAMKLDPAVVQAMILDNYGILVTDPRGYNTNNPSVYTAQQNATVQPRLYLRSVVDDVTGTGDVANLAVEAGEWNGEVLLSFDAPSDPLDGKAFGYDVRSSTVNNFATATKVDRWRIPRPATVGTTQKVLIESLTPGQLYYFFVGAYDKVGNTGNVMMTSLTLPAALATPQLANGGFPVPDPAGKTIRTVPGVLNYWACSELEKVNPATGNRMEDGYTGSGADDYKKANTVWDSATNTITLRPGRNEIMGFQVILQRLVANLTNVSVTASDLVGPGAATLTAANHIELFKPHYVLSGSTRYPDAAIPLRAPFATTFSLPDANTNPGGSNQSVWADVYIPKTATPGTYNGTVTINCTELGSPVVVNVQVIVHSAVIPDVPTFFLDLNGYGNKWSSAASRYQVFQLCHKHKMVPNTLPYGWGGSTNSDRRPNLSGSGPTTAISNWGTFASDYGPFFDGTGFSPADPTYPYHGPGENTPIANFYTTFHEGWPVSLTDATWGYDAAGLGWAYWNAQYDSGQPGMWAFYRDTPDVFAAFPAGYATGYSNVAQQFAQYAQDHNWRTAFQMYLNNKGTYANCIALWTLEEEYVADDFRADAWFLGLCKAGVEAANAPDVKWQWRIDTSTRWGQNWGQLLDICNLRTMGGDISWYYRQIRYRKYHEPLAEDCWWYGTGPSPTNRTTGHPARILMEWSHNLNGGLPYWDSYQTDWNAAQALSVLYAGDSVPGHGFYDGRIASIRMKGMRFGQQVAEYLNMLGGLGTWNRNLVARAMSARYGDHTGYAYDPWGGDLYDGTTILEYYQLHEDLLASIAAAVPSLISSEPAADATLPKTQNNVMLLTFDSAITLPGGAALTITSLPLPGTDVGGSFTYTIQPDGVTLKAKENGAVLSDLTWYRVAPAAGFGVQAFVRDFCTLQGDADANGQVLAQDYFPVKNNLFALTDARYDLDGNGQVLAQDYFVVKNHLFNAKPAKP